MPEEVIIPDSQGYSNEGIKLNLRNLFTFLSSLDYLKAIETSKAFDTLDSKQFFFTGEKQAIILFAYTHTSFWIFLAYIALLITSNMVFDVEPIYGILIAGLIWMFFGIWFVNRYTWGNGYLWQVTRDFMINLTIATIFTSIATDIIIYYLIPMAYKFIVNWLTSGPKDGLLNSFAQSALIWIESLAKPIKEKASLRINNFLQVYALVSVVKIISFLIPTILMFVLHSKRKDLRKRLNNILKEIA